MATWGADYGTIVSAAAAAIASYGGAWLARRWAPRWGWVDRPDGHRKLHARCTPLLGGVAVLGSFLAVSGWSYADDPLWLGLAGSAALLCLLGLWDDRLGMPARIKFVGQLAALAPFLWAAAAWNTHVELFGWRLALGGAVGVAAAAIWLAAAVNMLNLADGMDGAASAAALPAIGLAAACGLTASGAAANGGVWAVVLAASLAGFLAHNLPPARIFLGDAGSMTLGFLVGALIWLTWRSPAGGFPAAPAVAVLFVPAWDTLVAMARRRLQGRSIGAADRGHIHHRLRDHGLSTPRALFLLALLHGLMAASAAVSLRLGQDAWCAAAALALASGLAVGGVFGENEWRLLVRRLAGGGATAEAGGLIVSLRRDSTPDNETERRRAA